MALSPRLPVTASGMNLDGLPNGADMHPCDSWECEGCRTARWSPGKAQFAIATPQAAGRVGVRLPAGASGDPSDPVLSLGRLRGWPVPRLLTSFGKRGTGGLWGWLWGSLLPDASIAAWIGARAVLARGGFEAQIPSTLRFRLKLPPIRADMQHPERWECGGVAWLESRMAKPYPGKRR